METPTPAQDHATGESRLVEPPPVAQAAVFLDVDGTLVGHEDHPAAVHIDAELRTLLQQLAAATSGAVALISGRAIADIDGLFQPLRLAVAGQHGTERRSVDGSVHHHAPPASRLHDHAGNLQRFVRQHAGLLLEEKGASLALHYRHAPALGPLVEGEARRVLALLGDEFELQAGKFVYELKPSGKDKGTAIAEFMQEAPFVGRRPVFIGDDLTDELGFALVNRLGGYTVKVGAGATQAQWRLANAAAVRRWLAGLAASTGHRAG